MNIRTANQADFPAIVRLLNQVEAEPTNLEEMLEDENRLVAGKIRRRLVTEASGQTVGYALAVHYPSRGAGNFHLHVVVDAGFRRQGNGDLLYQAALDFARQHRAHTLTAEVQERYPEALGFAQRRGFQVKLQEVGATLELAHYRAPAPVGLPPHIHITTYAAQGDSLENRRRLYEINRIATVEDPGTTGGFPDFETWQRLIPEAGDFQPQGQFIAVDTRSAGQPYVGLSGVAYVAESNQTQTLLTGVHRDYRGQRIAQALKHAVIGFALGKGAAQLVTRVDTRNHPMLAINRKLGFVIEPGFYWLERRL